MEMTAFHPRCSHLGLEIRRPPVERAETRRQQGQLDNLHKPRFWIGRPESGSFFAGPDGAWEACWRLLLHLPKSWGGGG